MISIAQHHIFICITSIFEKKKIHTGMTLIVVLYTDDVYLFESSGS